MGGQDIKMWAMEIVRSEIVRGNCTVTKWPIPKVYSKWVLNRSMLFLLDGPLPVRVRREAGPGPRPIPAFPVIFENCLPDSRPVSAYFRNSVPVTRPVPVRFKKFFPVPARSRSLPALENRARVSKCCSRFPGPPSFWPEKNYLVINKLFVSSLWLQSGVNINSDNTSKTTWRTCFWIKSKINYLVY